MSPRTLCVLAKRPAAGNTKTRLARDIGEMAATRIATALLEDTWMWAHGSKRFLPVLVADDPAAWKDAGPSLDPTPRIWPQASGNLGTRIADALQRGADTHPTGALVIGSDAVGIPAETLEAAADLLDRGRAVIGPTDDGGYYLLGLPRAPEPGLFDNIPWSTPMAEEATRARLLDAGYEVAALRQWFDVDTAADLGRLAHLARARPERVPATSRLLRDDALRTVWPDPNRDV